MVAFGHKGTCIGKTSEGEAVLVEGAVPGDIVTFQPRRKKKGMKLGHTLEITRPSDDRTDPVCEHFEYCGGCNWQNFRYSGQCQQKEEIVINEASPPL